MKQTYRFVGTEMVIGDIHLTKFGEVVELTDAERAACGPNVPLVHDDLFDEVGFTDQELSLYAYPGQRIDAPEAVNTKIRDAWAVVGVHPEGN